MRFDAYIFDLDGTLLDTLGDLVILTNTVLSEQRFPTHSREAINSFVGGGARVLLQKATPAGTSDETIDRLMARWKQLYPELGHKTTQPYPGMADALAHLKGEGAKLGVLSNKFDAAVKSVIEEHFPGVFDLARGEGPDTPRKPDPTGLMTMMADLGVAPDRCAYVGDSGTDMVVAMRAGTTPIGVTWGYRTRSELAESGAQTLIESPGQLLT